MKQDALGSRSDHTFEEFSVGGGVWGRGDLPLPPLSPPSPLPLPSLSPPSPLPLSPPLPLRYLIDVVLSDCQVLCVGQCCNVLQNDCHNQLKHQQRNQDLCMGRQKAKWHMCITRWSGEEIYVWGGRWGVRCGVGGGVLGVGWGGVLGVGWAVG